MPYVLSTMTMIFIQGDFSGSSNATTLVFKTGASETATEKCN